VSDYHHQRRSSRCPHDVTNTSGTWDFSAPPSRCTTIHPATGLEGHGMRGRRPFTHTRPRHLVINPPRDKPRNPQIQTAKSNPSGAPVAGDPPLQRWGCPLLGRSRNHSQNFILWLPQKKILENGGCPRLAFEFGFPNDKPAPTHQSKSFWLYTHLQRR